METIIWNFFVIIGIALAVSSAICGLIGLCCALGADFPGGDCHSDAHFDAKGATRANAGAFFRYPDSDRHKDQYLNLDGDAD
jgi:hypothetical protein